MHFVDGSVDSSDDSIDGALRRDYTEEIPDECLASIFKFVDSVDRKSCSTVCHRWLRVEAESRRQFSINAEAKLLDIVPDLFSRFDSITTLALRCNRESTSINDEALILISLLCNNLTGLKLRYCREITEIGMLGLAKNGKSLKKLSCRDCMFGVKGIHAVIDNSTVLEELSINKVRGNNDDADSFIPSSSSAGSKKLKTLKIIRCLGNWDGMVVKIGKLNLGLVKIHLQSIQVSDVGLGGGVSNCLKLEVFILLNTPECSDAGISEVAENCKMLKKLHIDGCKSNRIGDDGLISVAKHCLNLEELALKAMSPTSLILAAIASSCLSLKRDADIEYIAAKCMALEKFYILTCPLSNAAIRAFASGSPNLFKLKVKNCSNITVDVLEWVSEKRASLPFNVETAQ